MVGKAGAGLSLQGLRQIKSELTNQIFRQEMLHIYEQKSVSRDELVRQTRKSLRELTRQMRSSICDQPDTERLMQELSSQLESVHGKKSYGYLPKQAKKIVDEIVDQMGRLPVVSECYDQWWQLQCQVDDHYSEKERKRPKLSEQKEFRAIKNAVMANLGLSFLSRTLVRQEVADGQLVEVPLDLSLIHISEPTRP